MNKVYFVLSLCSLSTLFACGGLTDKIETEEQRATAASQMKLKGTVVKSQALGGGPVHNALLYLDFKDEQSTRSGEDGKFELTIQMNPESSSQLQTDLAAMIVEAKWDEQLVGARIPDIEMEIGAVIDLGEIIIDRYGEIEGIAILHNQINHEGISVYIPGTSYTATTDEAGKFLLTGIPAGTYEKIAFKKDGFSTVFSSAIQVRPGELVFAKPTRLFLSLGVDGYLEIDRGNEYGCSLELPVNLYYSDNAVLMKVSTDQSFQNMSWEPVASTKRITFPSEGRKTAYAVFADSNGLQTSVLSDDIIIDITACSRGRWTPLSNSGGGEIPYGYWGSNFRIINLVDWICTWGYPSGGSSYSGYYGGCYAPKEDRWQKINKTGAPSDRYAFGNAGIGNAMCIWGGAQKGTESSTPLKTGSCYYPDVDRWIPMTTTGAPSARNAFIAFYMGGKLCIWGGYVYDGTSNVWQNNGSCYNPNTNSWAALGTSGTLPSERSNPTTVATDKGFCIWGGYKSGHLRTGSCYDSGTKKWSSINSTGAPSARNYASGVWSTQTKEMIIIGGSNITSSERNLAYAYSPSLNKWRSFTKDGAPVVGYGLFAGWTGTEMCVYSKIDSEDYWNEVVRVSGCLDPTSNQWTLLNTINHPPSSSGYDTAAGWAAGQLCVFHNRSSSSSINKGACWTDE